MNKPCPKCGGIVTADARVFDRVMAVHIESCPAPQPKKEVKK